MRTGVDPLEYTGERMVPEKCQDDVFWEHVYRYNFALKYTLGRDVLDIACGEGYGSAAMKEAGAKSVVGVDIDPTTCEHARIKYGIDARVGNAEAIPLPDCSVDVVVSFETLEHVNLPERFLAECERVLRPGGQLLISTPNKTVYGSDYRNPFHVKEMTLEEFRDELASRFTTIELYSQRPTKFDRRIISTYHLSYLSGSWWAKVIRLTGRFMRPLFTPGFESSASPATRQQVLKLIQKQVGSKAYLFNPNVVRPVLPKGEDCPMYYIAVARQT